MDKKTKKTESAFRPKQVLLIGLGGVGSRVVNSIMDNIPAEYKPYTQAVSLDTDKNDVKRLYNIPVENIIELGGSGTIGSFMKKNEDAADWMVKGRQLGLIKSRTTSNGAKQIRLVSRIALRATNQQGSIARKIEEAVKSVNAADGRLSGNGLLVLVVCSIAGGTGAGTVIQVPMYLEDIIKSSYSSENVQFECAMLMPNMFSENLSTKNLERARANAYAVMKEIVSLNKGKIKRFEYLDNIDVDVNDDRWVPYGRIMVFDDRTGRGESIKGDIDTVHTPLVVDALTEYLYGPANGKITSALDNTLAEVYSSDGEAVFGAVGKANVIYPRAAYQQYAVSKWIESSISETWLYPDYKAEEAYQSEIIEARKNGNVAPESIKKYEYYCDAVNDNTSLFFKDIQNQMIVDSDDVSVSTLAEEYWKNVTDEFLERYFKNNEDVSSAYANVTLGDDFTYRKRRGLSAAQAGFNNYRSALEAVSTKVTPFVNDIMRPMESKKDSYYDNTEDNDETIIARFIRNKNLHPIGLRCFLYDLYYVLNESIIDATIPSTSDKSDSEWDDMLENKKDRDIKVSNFRNDMEAQAQLKYKSDIAKKMLPLLQELIQEVEDFFIGIKKSQSYFRNTAKRLLFAIDNLDTAADKVVAGSALSAHNCWKLLENTVHFGSGDSDGPSDIIDNDLSKKLNKLIYEGYFKHVDMATKTSAKLGSDKFRIATNYVDVLLEELPNYFNNKIKTEYSSFFPKNVIEAVKYDCCVKNFWNIMKNEDEYLTEEEFVCSEPYNEEYYEVAKGSGLPAFDFKETLTRLLAKGVGKAEPRCGIIRIDGDSDYTTRYVIMNEDILQKDTKEANDDEDVFEQKLVPVYKEFVPGVSTTDIEGTFVNACFNGPSRDTITFVTSYGGLCARNFALLLDSSYNEYESQDGMNYFQAYRAYINKMIEREMDITPHLHCGWHLADRLVDITIEHTQSIWQRAAKAFVYGFVYDTIQVQADGTIIFGKSGEKIFINAFGGDGTKTKVDALAGDTKSVLDILDKDSQNEHTNAILNYIFNYLTTAPKVCDAIIEHAENIIADDTKYGNTSFISNAQNAEKVAGFDYNCILDVIDGYYAGTIKLEHIEEKYAVETTRYMFRFFLRTMFEQIKTKVGNLADVRKICKQLVDKFYLRALCDESIPTTVKKGEHLSEIDEILMSIKPSDNAVNQRPFTEGGIFDQSKAQDFIVQLLRESV